VIKGPPFPVCATTLAADSPIRRFRCEPWKLDKTPEDVLDLGYWDKWVLTNLKDPDMIGRH
jgi:hypothetical protein